MGKIVLYSISITALPQMYAKAGHFIAKPKNASIVFSSLFTGLIYVKWGKKSCFGWSSVVPIHWLIDLYVIMKYT